jgi:hypothetical protein
MNISLQVTPQTAAELSSLRQQSILDVLGVRVLDSESYPKEYGELYERLRVCATGGLEFEVTLPEVRLLAGRDFPLLSIRRVADSNQLKLSAIAQPNANATSIGIAYLTEDHSVSVGPFTGAHTIISPCGLLLQFPRSCLFIGVSNVPELIKVVSSEKMIIEELRKYSGLVFL